MPKGGRRKTTWTKETAPKSRGRPKGSGDKVPHAWKQSMKAMFDEYGAAHADELWKAIDRGVRAKPPRSFPYLQLIAVSVDGRNTQAVPLDQVRAFAFAMMGAALHFITSEKDRLQFADRMRRLGVAHRIISATAPGSAGSESATEIVPAAATSAGYRRREGDQLSDAQLDARLVELEKEAYPDQVRITTARLAELEADAERKRKTT